MQMPFGKYQGQGLDEIPRDYLEWLLDAGIRSKRLRQAITDELDRRASDRRSHSRGTQPPPPNKITIPDEHKPFIDEIVRSGYRTASKRCHPDHGGSGDQFRALHAAYEWLAEKGFSK